MKKNLLRIGIALVLVVGSLFVYNQFFRQGNVGSKEVQIILTIDQNGEDIVILDVTKRTDDEMLGTFLETILEEEELEYNFSGSVSDPYGRYIVGIGDHVTTDSTVGPWWLFNSTTNVDCVSAGFCPGIDITPLYDKDIFTFEFTASY
jgi:hypothetical protein